MTELKTIAQIAAELGVSRQAVYSKIKSDELSHALKPETVRQGNTNLYTVKAQQLITQAFFVNKENKDSSELTEIKAQLESMTNKLTENEKELDSTAQQLKDRTAELQEKEQALKSLTECKVMLKSEIDVLKAQRTDKDNQISMLQSQLADRDKTIDLLQSQLADFKADKQYLKDKLDDITTALTAAQALHGIEKKQTVIEVKEQASDNEPAETTAPDQSETPQEPQQKLSLFERIFKRSKKQR